jgi:hypothetical protein
MDLKLYPDLQAILHTRQDLEEIIVVPVSFTSFIRHDANESALVDHDAV